MGNTTKQARILAVGEQAKPDFTSYAVNAQNYLNRPQWNGTPITGQMLAQAASDTYNKTGQLVPLELALAQGQLETHLGSKVRSPNNFFNIGETDAGGHVPYNNPQDGINAYYNLMATKYLKKSTPDDLRQNFVNSKGNRYASNPNYEKLVGGQMDYITKYLNNQGGQ